MTATVTRGGTAAGSTAGKVRLTRALVLASRRLAEYR